MPGVSSSAPPLLGVHCVDSNQYVLPPAFPSVPAVRSRPKRAGCLGTLGSATAARAILLVLLVAAGVAASQLLDAAVLKELLDWALHDRITGGSAFLALYVVAVIIMFPASILACAAGAVFGVPLAFILVWAANSIGQTLAFLVGRHLMQAAVKGWTQKRFPRWASIDAALSREGWKLVALLRLSPLIPWNILNYALSITSLPLPTYAIASCLAVIPWCLMFVYVGSLAHTVADVVEGNLAPTTTLSVTIASASAFLLVAGVAYTTLIARRAIRAALQTGVPNDGGTEMADDLESAGLLQSPFARRPSTANAAGATFGENEPMNARRGTLGSPGARRSSRSLLTMPSHE
ncbi:hypothetical protein WJX84_010194 [Apatococcus fuscideae]|uniref:VTT domain-containing protein n=1 Tax=Apatococcus fuscideae TaxID=2026836 RepID=A0AAW1TLH7_9CHLO